MRILHTSDWHFGKRFLETDMIPQQELFADWIADVVTAEKIDAVLVSGDVYDRANPKDNAVDLLDDVLHRISAAGAAIVMISGNHDSAERLHFGTRFMAGSGLHIRTERRDLSDIGGPVVLRDKDGTDVEILPIPYLDPERIALPDGESKTHEAALRAAIDLQIAQLKNPALAIAMSHAFVVGGQESESERQLSIGGTGAVPASLFDAFGYVALGHLHRPQEMGDGRLVYSGTPMAYSFSEEHDKSVRILTVEKGKVSSEIVPSTSGRAVITIEGTMSDLLTSSAFASASDLFVRARVTDANFQVGAMDRLRGRFPYILEMEQTSIAAQGQIDAERLKELTRRSDEEVVDEYVKETWPEDFGAFETQFVKSAVKAAVTGEDA